jgi:hypothetical protein
MRSPEWIHDVNSLLDRIYEDPLYRQTHPQSQGQNWVETVEVSPPSPLPLLPKRRRIM